MVRNIEVVILSAFDCYCNCEIFYFVLSSFHHSFRVDHHFPLLGII